MSCNQHITFLFLLGFGFAAMACKKEPPVSPQPGGSRLDTTSHNFTWAKYTFFGNTGSSGFKDVAVINDSDIWAVGSMYATPDTVDNAAHWDGEKWDLLQIQFYTICGQSHTTPYIINAVFAFSKNDVWFATAGEILHYINGTYEHHCSIISLINGGINKIWGTSSSNLYAVGNAGSIICYNGSSW